MEWNGKSKKRSSQDQQTLQAISGASTISLFLPEQREAGGLGCYVYARTENTRSTIFFLAVKVLFTRQPLFPERS